MWPFKSRPKLTLEEVAAAEPPAPCGNQLEHTAWKSMMYPCPLCVANEDARREKAKQEQLAELIAAAVVRKIKEQSQ